VEDLGGGVEPSPQAIDERLAENSKRVLSGCEFSPVHCAQRSQTRSQMSWCTVSLLRSASMRVRFEFLAN